MGYEISENAQKFLILYKEAKDKNNLKAQYELANYYAGSKDEKLHGKAFSLYKKAADKAPDGTPSAEGCYLNYLETENDVFFSVFSRSHETDMRAISTVKKALGKRVIPLNVIEIALYGGILNCISWEK